MNWVQKLISRESLWPAVGIVVSVVWLFRSPMGTTEFESWAFAYGALTAVLSGGVIAAKRLAPPPPPACEPGPTHGCPTSSPSVPGGGVPGETPSEPKP